MAREIKTPTFLYLTSEDKSLRIHSAKKFTRDWDGRWRIYNTYYPYASRTLSFYFTNPLGKKYFELLREFEGPAKTLKEAKAAVGINTTHWASFAESAISLGLMEKIPHTWTYTLTTEGRMYIASVLAGNSKFTLKTR